MALRFDAKTVLGMFNQSRLASEEQAQRDKINAINKDLADRQLAEQIRERDQTLEEARRQHDQAVTWHDADVKRQIANDQLNATRYAGELGREKARDEATATYNQGMLGYYNRMAAIAENKQLGADGKPLTDSQMKAKARADFEAKKAGLQTELNQTMKGFNFDAKPSSSFSKGAIETKEEMQRSLGVYNGILGTLQKYDEQGYPATALNQGLVTKIRQRLSDSQDWLKSIHGIQSDPNVRVDDATGLYPGTMAIGTEPRVPSVSQDDKNALFNAWNDVNARLSQYDASGLSQAGLVTDPATGRQYKVGF